MKGTAEFCLPKIKIINVNYASKTDWTNVFFQIIESKKTNYRCEDTEMIMKKGICGEKLSEDNLSKKKQYCSQNRIVNTNCTDNKEDNRSNFA